MSIYLKFKLLIAGMLTIASINTALIYTLEHFSSDKLEWVTHTNKVLLESQSLLSALKDVETGQRGFLLTHDKSYLDPYYLGKKDTQLHLKNIRELTKDNPIQQDRLYKIETLMKLKFEELAQTITLAQKGHHAQAMKIVSGNAGKKYMEALRDSADILIKTEETLLEKRKTELYLANEFILNAVLIMLVIFILVAFLVNRFLNQRLFVLLKKLLVNVKKMENNETIDTIEIKNKDEIGALVLGFKYMYEKSRARTLESKQFRDSLEVRAWVHSGVNELSKQLSLLTDIEKINRTSLRFVCDYVGLGIGAIYTYDQTSEHLSLTGSYALAKQDTLVQGYALGDAIVGEVAQSKEPMIFEHSTQEQKLIDTACTKELSVSSYTYPLLFREDIVAVIELAFAKHLNDDEKEFVVKCNEVIAIALYTTEKNEKVTHLLSETDKANIVLEENNAQMEEQQQQLEENNTQMEEQQQQLMVSQADLKNKNESLSTLSKELEENYSELELASKYKTEFLANMSHELRTPLNSIILLSSLLSKNSHKKLDETEVKHAQTINQSGEELLRLINDILDISKIESGHMDLEKEVFSLEKLGNEMHGLFGEVAQSKGLEFVIEGATSFEYEGDRHKISQLIKNLLSNAIKFTSEGKVVLHFEQNDALELWVKDEGIGIAEDMLKTVFEPFKQGDGTISRSYGGTGLGLSISREIAQIMGGNISVESVEGKGSCFKVLFTDVKQIQLSKKSTAHIPVKEKLLNLADRSILIIEDNLESAQYYHDSVVEYGLACHVAHSGKEGLAKLKEHNIQGVLLDLGLPDMSGVDVIKILKADSETKHIPIHIISATQKNKNIFDEGASGYLEKPFNDQELKDALMVMLDELKLIGTLSLEGCKICVVDDDVKNIYVLDALLKSYDAEVVSAYNGAEAIELVESDSSIDVVLMDVMMPVMNGYEAIEKLRQNSTFDNLPIIVTTAKAIKGEKEKCLNLGANDYISKPIDEVVLLEIIRKLCHR